MIIKFPNIEIEAKLMSQIRGIRDEDGNRPTQIIVSLNEIFNAIDEERDASIVRNHLLTCILPACDDDVIFTINNSGQIPSFNYFKYEEIRQERERMKKEGDLVEYVAPKVIKKIYE